MNNIFKQIIESKFNFNIDIEGSERQNSLSKSKYNSISQKKLYLDQYIVDLGLPSKTIWYRYNLGVDINQLDKAKDWYGDYYAWGEIEPKNAYSKDNYKYGKVVGDNMKLTKYCGKKWYGYKQYVDELKTLQLEDDAAYQKLNISNFSNLEFVMPTMSQFNELKHNTYNEWIDNYKGIKGLNGRIFKSIFNDNELFIPATSLNDNLKSDYDAYVWTSTLHSIEPTCAYALYFYRNNTAGNTYYSIVVEYVG